MTITVCDICGRKLLSTKFADPIKSLNFCISSYGKKWDICDKCRASLNGWINVLRQGWEETCESESEE